MKKLLLVFGSMFLCVSAFGQLNTLGSNKPLGFLNPALQNIDYSRGIISTSYLVNPLAEENQTPAYLALAEFAVGDNVRVGVKSLSIEDRLFGETKIGVYSSFRLPLAQ